MRRDSWFAAGELHGHLPTGLDRNRVVKDLPDILHAQLMYEPNLVRIHETGITHHVAAVGEVDRQDSTSAILDGAGAVIVKLLVVMSGDVAPREHGFDMRKELRIDCHYVFEMA